MLGMVSEADKASLLRSVDVYVAPNTGGESFGIILLEAMAARTPIVASDLQAFRRVLGAERAGAPATAADPAGLLFRNRDPPGWPRRWTGAGRPGAARPAGRGRRRGGPALRLERGRGPDPAGLRDRDRGHRAGLSRPPTEPGEPPGPDVGRSTCNLRPCSRQVG